MKFTQIIQEPPSTHEVQLTSEDSDQQNLHYQIDIRNSIDLKQIYEYSQRNMIQAQEMVIQPNFMPQFDDNRNLREFRQLQAQSLRVSRGLIQDPFEKVCFMKQKIKESHAESTRPMTPLKPDQNHKNYLQVRKSMDQFTKDKQSLRVSIFFKDEKQPFNSINYKYKGPIPLKDNGNKESQVIKTYRQAKNRLEQSIEKPIEQQRKKKVAIKKQQNSRFKGSLIAYDYNGQPIPLKNNKKNTVFNTISKPLETILVTPMTENIVLPSATNKTRLQKRKARYLQDGQQKQNQRHYQDQQIVVLEGSQFLRIIPKEIEKSRIFKDEQENDDCSKSLDRLSFSQFKKNANRFRNFRNCQNEIKQTKSKLTGLNMSENKKSKRSLKRVHINHGRMMTNEIIFERIFHFKPQCEYPPSQQDIIINNFQQNQIQRENRQRGADSSNRKYGLKGQNQNKEAGKSKHISGMSSYLANEQSCKKEMKEPLVKQQKTSIMRNSFRGSPQNATSYPTPSLPCQSTKKVSQQELMIINRYPFQTNRKLSRQRTCFQNMDKNMKTIKQKKPK